MQAFTFTAAVERLIDLALEEDIGSGDITTKYLIAPDRQGQGTIFAKENLVLSGISVAESVFWRLDPQITFKREFQDGDEILQGAVVLHLNGSMAAMLTGERTALNFLQRLSGIATHVRSHVTALKNTKVRLVDTRKTTPGWRILEKYAVRCGGSANHRMGLYDGVLIKDNHITACGSIAKAVNRIQAQVSHLSKIEVETTNLKEVQQALDAGAHVIMLDNMDKHQIQQAVQLIKGRALIEVSGGVTHESLTDLADTGVDIISVGALTHSAQAVDLSMRIENKSHPIEK